FVVRLRELDRVNLPEQTPYALDRLPLVRPGLDEDVQAERVTEALDQRHVDREGDCSHRRLLARCGTNAVVPELGPAYRLRLVFPRLASEHSERYFEVAAELARAIDPAAVDAIAEGLASVRDDGGRLFAIGVGGGAGHASHAVNDFRKLCALECYA